MPSPKKLKTTYLALNLMELDIDEFDTFEEARDKCAEWLRDYPSTQDCHLKIISGENLQIADIEITVRIKEGK